MGDGKFEEVKLSTKEKVKVTPGNYRSLITDCTNAKDRQKIFEAVFDTYEKHKTTYATIYNTVLQADQATAKARGYNSSLEAHLYGENIPLEVYYNLVDVASKYNKGLKKYIKLRKKYPTSKINVEVKEQYKNMRTYFDKDMGAVDLVVKALKKNNIELPDFSLVQFSTIDQFNGWGDKFDGTKLSLILKD